MTIETVQLEGIDDKSLFAGATADETPVETQQVEQTQELAEQPRNERGQFAPKADEPAIATTEQVQQPVLTDDKADAQIPSWRAREIAEERRQAVARYEESERGRAEDRRQLADLQRQLAAMQPKKEPTDFFTDPVAALREQLSPVEQQFQELRGQMVLRASRAEAIAANGLAPVKEMEQAIEAVFASRGSRDPEMQALSARMRASDDPIGVAMDWHKREKLLKETGGDVSAFRAKTLDEALKDPAFLAKALEAAKAQAQGGGQRPNNIMQLPPSLSRIPSGGDPDDTDMSDGALFRHATRP